MQHNSVISVQKCRSRFRRWLPNMLRTQKGTDIDTTVRAPTRIEALRLQLSQQPRAEVTDNIAHIIITTDMVSTVLRARALRVPHSRCSPPIQTQLAPARRVIERASRV